MQLVTQGKVMIELALNVLATMFLLWVALGLIGVIVNLITYLFED